MLLILFVLVHKWQWTGDSNITWTNLWRKSRLFGGMTSIEFLMWNKTMSLWENLLRSLVSSQFVTGQLSNSKECRLPKGYDIKLGAPLNAFHIRIVGNFDESCAFKHSKLMVSFSNKATRLGYWTLSMLTLNCFRASLALRNGLHL